MRRLLLCLALACGCNHSGENGMPDMTSPFKPVPECKPDTLKVAPLMGDRQMLVATLKIADFNEGFDLNADGKIDNKLAPLGSLGNSAIVTSFKFQHNIILPIELFGYTGSDSDCAKFAFYLGRVIEDKDSDGKSTSWEGPSGSPPNFGKADCDDSNGMVFPGAKEVIGNRVDDDCDGLADNMKPFTPSSDTMDLDGDGFSPMQGDCDDRMAEPMAAMRHPGDAATVETHCGSGIDWNCDGIPDNGPTCDPFGDNKVSVHVQALSFGDNAAGMSLPLDGGVTDAGQDTPVDVTGYKPLIVFADGNVQGGVLNAGPDLFELSLPFQSDININLTLTGAHVRMALVDKPLGTYITPNNAMDPNDKIPHGLLGGVLEAVSLAQIKGISAGGVLTPEQSLLDAVFVGPVATILGLDTDDDGHYLPDIDVDGDGLETFWQCDMAKDPKCPFSKATSDAGAAPAEVNTCKDGDGTIVYNNFDGNGTPCALAKDAKGNYRFVDGLSVALKFTAVPVKIQDVTVK